MKLKQIKSQILVKGDSKFIDGIKVDQIRGGGGYVITVNTNKCPEVCVTMSNIEGPKRGYALNFSFRHMCLIYLTEVELVTSEEYTWLQHHMDSMSHQLILLKTSSRKNRLILPKETAKMSKTKKSIKLDF